MKIINFGTTEDMDMYLIPNAIYKETINKHKLKIQEYFIKNPKIMFSFVGFNGALKLANQLAYNKKCGCFYTIPWTTYYDHIYGTKSTSLTFAQQVDEYRYMILNWYPSPRISNMQYLSQIALGMILEIKQYWYYIQNNLSDCTLFQKDWYKNNFNNERILRLYILKNFSGLLLPKIT
jgi:hypothetical protein